MNHFFFFSFSAINMHMAVLIGQSGIFNDEVCSDHDHSSPDGLEIVTFSSCSRPPWFSFLLYLSLPPSSSLLYLSFHSVFLSPLSSSLSLFLTLSLSLPLSLSPSLLSLSPIQPLSIPIFIYLFLLLSLSSPFYLSLDLSFFFSFHLSLSR